MRFPRDTLGETVIGAAKFYFSRFFHVFENSFGPPGAGELRFEQIPRNFIRFVCCLLGPEYLKQLIPKRWIDEQTSSFKRGPSIKEWLPLQLANYTTWPKYIPTVEYPPPPRIVSGSPCRITYYGHSSVLIQTQESNVLVDPFFGSRLGPRLILGKVEVFSSGSKTIYYLTIIICFLFP